LELAVRGAYPLVVSGRLNADRGSANNNQPDRRTPGEVLDKMRLTLQGVHQLGQALRDFAARQPIRAVDDTGAIKLQGDGGDQLINDIYLRTEFHADGKAGARRPGETPMDRYHNGINALAEAMAALTSAFDELRQVVGDDGQPLVETRGVDHRSCAAWRDQLTQIDDELVLWSVTHRRANGVKADPRRIAEEDRVGDDGPAEIVEDWERAGGEDELEAAK